VCGIVDDDEWQVPKYPEHTLQGGGLTCPNRRPQPLSLVPHDEDPGDWMTSPQSMSSSSSSSTTSFPMTPVDSEFSRYISERPSFMDSTMDELISLAGGWGPADLDTEPANVRRNCKLMPIPYDKTHPAQRGRRHKVPEILQLPECTPESTLAFAETPETADGIASESSQDPTQI
jgi:hypothetical protein